MRRRTFLQCGLALTVATKLIAGLKEKKLVDAARVLEESTKKGTVSAASLHVKQGSTSFSRHFGAAKSNDAMFLLGSITKPICVTALMTQFDKGLFKLDDPLKKFIPGFTGEGRDQVTIRNLLTHVSGLPDQLPENNELRKKHAGLAEFIEHAFRTPLGFAPGAKYQYSSMGILLACHVAEIVSGTGIQELVDRTVFQPLSMKQSSLGLGRFTQDEMIACQTEHAATESGAGDPSAKDWDWNSRYWRNLGAPWGGAHASASDIGRFLAEFLGRRGQAIKPETAAIMIANQNPSGLTSRGLGLNVGSGAGSPGCSDRSFGHSGSTGTLAWADPATETTCVVLTSLPGGAIKPHPRDLAAAEVAMATV